MLRTQNNSFLTKYMKHEMVSLIVLCMIMLISTIVMLLNPQVLAYFIDAAVNQQPLQMLFILALGYIGIAILTQIFNIISTYISTNIAWKVTNQVRLDVTEHCLRLNLDFHNKKTTGEFIERIDGDVLTLGNFFSNFWAKMISNLLLLIGILILLFRVNIEAGIIFAIFSAISFFILNKIRGLAIKYWGEARQTSAELYGFLEERLNGIEDVKAVGAETHVFKRMYQILIKRLQTERTAFLYGGVIWACSIAFFTLGNVLALAIIAFLFMNGKITIGTAYLVFAYVNMLRVPIEQITSQVQDFQRAGASIRRTQELLDVQSPIHDNQVTKDLGDLVSVQFDNVTFGYQEGTTVLDNVSFTLDAGKAMTILGKTGSGKSTLTKLLVRLYDPVKGSIRLNGVDIRDIGVAFLRSKVAMISQHVQLMTGTLRDNITMFNDEMKDEAILKAFKELDLWSWYEQLELGLDTEIKSDGSNFSAGEAQIIAFLRIYMMSPQVIILDEISSHLDTITEQLLLRATKKLFLGRTGIIIAHRLKTIEYTDEIMVLEQGVIVERGERDQLIQSSDSYLKRLVAAESGGGSV
ncbi:hypothetical protein BBG47_14425 [Paenibacillus sp. KS1]|uniref:ABC transporter ATP-binding protein n=1 Tax=Paenibacillus sp. KS1 TaxID=1849249 RepID=UPI0008064605|nr:ABC transporter ATP-binding protein [Paenibacillus sp. KS1]OBY78849.1 hypothetical protein BBG47_14425 [Paenibacillus sp. KS1]